jgi:GNAT superfamily N-acetyltransferase
LSAVSVALIPASSLDDDSLAALFTAVYAGYWHPIAIDAAGLRHMIATYDLVLDASVVAVDGDEPVAVALLAARGTEGWVGGMGVLPERRGTGLGTAVTERLLASARERALRRVRLEVLEQNAPAIAVYRKLGFADVRDVAVWTLTDPPVADPADDVDLDDALAQLGAAGADAPWQRSAATIARMREAGAELVAVGSSGGGTAVYSLAHGNAALQEIVAPDPASTRSLLRAPFERGASTSTFLNGPVNDVVAATLDDVGATRLALQHELAVGL